eukprot:gene10931-12153_t
MKIKVHSSLNHPCLVSFPQGLPIHEEELDVLAGRKGKEKKNEKVIVTAKSLSTPGFQFKGTNFGDSSKVKNTVQFAIGVVDPSRPGVMTVVPADHVYVLRPHIPRLEEAQELRSNKIMDRLNSATPSERRESLTNEFGSKKKKRALQAMKSNVISAENISAANELEALFTARSPESRAEVVEVAKQALTSAKKRKRA